VESQLVGVISDAMWEDAFGRKDVVNRTLTVNGISVRIIGIAPPKFDGVLAVGDARRLTMWLPLATRSAVLAGAGPNRSAATALSSVDSTLFQAVGRLRPGVSLEQATAAVRVVTTHAISQMTPPRAIGPNNSKPPALVYDADVAWLRGWVGSNALGMPPSGPVGAVFGMLGTVATLLLLVVCTNVAALVVSAAVGRRQEIAVRLSLGASRGRVIRQLLTESTVLAVIGGALGLTVYWGVIVALSRVPEAADFRPDLGTVAFTMCVALGTGILCGLAPALHATRTDVAVALKGTEMGATRRSRLQHTFVVAQVMFTQPLLVLIAVLIGTVLHETTQSLPNGVSERVLKLAVDMTSTPGSVAQKNAALERLLVRIAETPGVLTVLPEPVHIGNARIAVRAEDRGSVASAAAPVTSQMKAVTPGYFDLMGVPLVRGSDAKSRSDTSRTMIIGSDLARQVFGDADPMGRRFSQLSPPQAMNRDLVVSGVYDSRFYDRGNSALVFRAVTKVTAGNYLIRTTVPASDLVVSIRRIAREELPSSPIASLETLAQIKTAGMRNTRALQAGLAAVAALILLLSSIGLYGAVALGVGQRRREIGIRMALGARAGQVVALFYGGGVRLGIIGLVLGLPMSLVALSFLTSRGTSSGDIDTAPSLMLVGAIIAGLVLVVASVATLIPAARAARVNPVIALRSE
jgi:predicted permease